MEMVKIGFSLDDIPVRPTRLEKGKVIPKGIVVSISIPQFYDIGIHAYLDGYKYVTITLRHGKRVHDYVVDCSDLIKSWADSGIEIVDSQIPPCYFSADGYAQHWTRIDSLSATEEAEAEEPRLKGKAKKLQLA